MFCFDSHTFLYGQTASSAVYSGYSIPDKRYLEKQKKKIPLGRRSKITWMGSEHFGMILLKFNKKTILLQNETLHTHNEAQCRNHTLGLLTVSLFLSLRRTKKELPWRPLGCLETPVNQVRNSRETKRLTLTSSREASEAALLPDSGELTPDYTRLLFHTDQNSSLSFIDWRLTNGST